MVLKLRWQLDCLLLAAPEQNLFLDISGFRRPSVSLGCYTSTFSQQLSDLHFCSRKYSFISDTDPYVYCFLHSFKDVGYLAPIYFLNVSELTTLIYLQLQFPFAYINILQSVELPASQSDKFYGPILRIMFSNIQIHRTRDGNEI